jgi:hypothetical protein
MIGEHRRDQQANSTCRRECEKRHAPQLLVTMGVRLLLDHLDVPSGQDLVALEAFRTRASA